MEKIESRTSKIEGTSMKKAPLPRPYPWLVYKHDKKDQGQIFCSISESRATEISRRYIPELRNKKIMACSYGWVVLCDREGVHCSLWNPVTSESISLPPLNLKHNQYIGDCLLTGSPSGTDSKMLLFGGNFHSILCCQLSSQKQWIEIGYYNQIRSLKKNDDEYILERPVCCNGKIYATSSCCYPPLLLIELDGSNNVTVSVQTKLPMSQHMPFPRVGWYLVESLGEIFDIGLNFGGVEDGEVIFVEIFKLDFSSMTWARVTRAKDRVFFAGNEYMISCPAPTSHVGGSRIYFTLGDKNLYSYNIEDQSILVSLPCPDLPTPYKPPYWIMPDLNRVDEEPEKTCVLTTGEAEEKDVLRSERESIGKIAVKAKEAEMMINLQDLPWLALNGIARCLTLVDYMNFRAACSAFCSVAPPIHWKTEFAGLKSQLLSPWLIFPENNKGIYHLVDSRLNNRCFLSIPDLLQDTSIRCSKDGWLVMTKRFSVTLFNPFTKDIIQLPDIPDPMIVGDTSFILTCSPSSQDCCIIGVSLLQTLIGISIIRPGENEWEYYELDSEKPLERNYNNGVFYQGAFYFLNEKGMLEVLKIEDEVRWESLDEPVAPCTSFHQNYLLECDGDLLAIFVGKLGESVKIFKLNCSKLVWEKVTSLKNYALYLNLSSPFSAEVKTPEMKNRIYFPRFHSQSIVFYSLDRGKFVALGSEYSLTNYYNTAIQLDCAWIEPSWC